MNPKKFHPAALIQANHQRVVKVMPTVSPGLQMLATAVASFAEMWVRVRKGQQMEVTPPPAPWRFKLVASPPTPMHVVPGPVELQ